MLGSASRDTSGTFRSVLELPTPTQDLEVFVPAAFFSLLLEAAERHHGILHLLFHPGHIHKACVQEALHNAVESARRKGLEWWTARDINTWERARRRALVLLVAPDRLPQLQLEE